MLRFSGKLRLVFLYLFAKQDSSPTSVGEWIVFGGAFDMKVIILGGDGFCGWPTALHLSKQGHDILIVDNLSRRNIDIELECDSLTPIQPMSIRLATWQRLMGKAIRFVRIDVAREYDRLAELVRAE